MTCNLCSLSIQIAYEHALEQDLSIVQYSEITNLKRHQVNALNPVFYLISPQVTFWMRGGTPAYSHFTDDVFSPLSVHFWCLCSSLSSQGHFPGSLGIFGYYPFGSTYFSWCLPASVLYSSRSCRLKN